MLLLLWSANLVLVQPHCDPMVDHSILHGLQLQKKQYE